MKDRAVNYEVLEAMKNEKCSDNPVNVKEQIKNSGKKSGVDPKNLQGCDDISKYFQRYFHDLRGKTGILDSDLKCVCHK